MPKKKSVFDSKRYWYHVSTTLNRRRQKLIPWDSDKAFNRASVEPIGRRICVAPSIEQCITAIPYAFATVLTVYRTEKKVYVFPAIGVYDSPVTEEGWIIEPTTFVKVGTLDFEDIERKLNIENVMYEAASSGKVERSRKVCQWWRKINVKKFVKRY